MDEIELKALARVITYMFDDEAADWREQDEEGKRNHIYLDLLVLKDLLRQEECKV